MPGRAAPRSRRSSATASRRSSLRGGKGVATHFGAVFALAWPAGGRFALRLARGRGRDRLLVGRLAARQRSRWPRSLWFGRARPAGSTASSSRAPHRLHAPREHRPPAGRDGKRLSCFCDSSRPALATAAGVHRVGLLGARSATSHDFLERFSERRHHRHRRPACGPSSSSSTSSPAKARRSCAPGSRTSRPGRRSSARSAPAKSSSARPSTTATCRCSITMPTATISWTPRATRTSPCRRDLIGDPADFLKDGMRIAVQFHDGDADRRRPAGPRRAQSRGDRPRLQGRHRHRHDETGEAGDRGHRQRARSSSIRAT